jgi:glycerol-3-phosphate acyltransferase PlsY
MTAFLLTSAFSYLAGSLSFGHIISKLLGIDIGQIGSRSFTATNVARAAGWKWGSLVAVLDFSKGVLPVLLARPLFENEWQIIIVALMPTIGHIFPIFFRFRGGKGGSTFLGACLGLVGLRFFIPAFLVWMLIFAVTKRTSLANLLFPWLFSIFLYVSFPQYLAFGIIGGLILVFALRENIYRLINKKEPQSPLRL